MNLKGSRERCNSPCRRVGTAVVSDIDGLCLRKVSTDGQRTIDTPTYVFREICDRQSLQVDVVVNDNEAIAKLRDRHMHMTCVTVGSTARAHIFSVHDGVRNRHDLEIACGCSQVAAALVPAGYISTTGVTDAAPHPRTLLTSQMPWRLPMTLLCCQVTCNSLSI